MKGRRLDTARTQWLPLTGYALLLALAAAALRYLDYLWLARAQPTELYIALVALAFLIAGTFLGARLTLPAQRPAGNPAARAALGISPRELDVLHQLATGASNKEIARTLDVSPNTVKTHAARLYEKLDVRRRTEAIARARDLGLLT